jgi:MFS family permease
MADPRRLSDAPEPENAAWRAQPVPSGPHSSPQPAGAARRRVQALRQRSHISAPATTRGFRTLLRNRYFLRLWMAQLISQTVQNAANYGLIVLIAARSNTSYLATSFAIVAFALPAVVFGAPAGVLVDRFNRRAVLWVSNALRAALAIAFAVSLLVDERALLPAYALSFFMAMIGQFFAPAEGAAIPLLVHSEELINALSLFNITFTIAQALGLIILAPLILLFMPVITIGGATHSIQLQPIDSLFVIVALLYLACVFLVLSIPKRRLTVHESARHRHRHGSSTQIHSVWTSVMEVLHFIRRDRRLVAAVAQYCIGGTVIAVIAMIAPGFVHTFFNQQPEQAALVFVPAGLGLVVGSAVTPNIVRRLHFTATITIGFIALAVSTVVLTITRTIAVAADPHSWYRSWSYLILAIALTFCIGIALDLVNVPAQTEMQERSPDWIKGRVLAVQGMLLNGITVPFVPLMGIVADRLGILPAMDILAICIVVTGLSTVVFARRAGHVPIAPDRQPPVAS